MVSVLFADLTGSTPLGERVDAEDLRNVLKVFFDSMSRQVLRYEGTIDKYVGDAVMAVFGAPVSHEDDAIRALNAALGMQRAVAALNVDLDLERTYGARLALRIGVSSGEVVAGRLGGESAAAYTVVGDTVNTAQRLQAAAAPGEIVVGETARRFAWHSFVFEELPPLMLKGKARPVPAYRVLGWRREGATPDAHALVGRSDELAHLRSALGELSRTTGRVMGIVGEAGVGKSRLVREFRASCTPGVNHLLGRCQSFETNTPYALVASLVRGLFHLQVGEDEPTARRVLASGLADPAIETDLPLLLHVLRYSQRSPLSRRRLRGYNASWAQYCEFRGHTTRRPPRSAAA